MGSKACSREQGLLAGRVIVECCVGRWYSRLGVACVSGDQEVAEGRLRDWGGVRKCDVAHTRKDQVLRDLQHNHAYDTCVTPSKRRCTSACGVCAARLCPWARAEGRASSVLCYGPAQSHFCCPAHLCC